ncbi:MAG TPA: hypothetical protein VJP85_14045 [Candidatus Baltobacteraceae bacterium]|nr:hypothetical protein [Candidatus Baltobacteraceae bacterium]
MFARRHWIPPAALVYAHLAHGFAWVLLLWAAWSASVHGYVGFAWIHAVVLAWVTMSALAILLHALPNFVDVEWRGETVARWSLVAYAAGTALLIYGFLGNSRVLGPAGDLLLASIVVYVGTALWTLAQTLRGERVQRAVARAFAGTFLFLLATAVIGYGLAGMLAGRTMTWAASLPSAHAALGTLGWLSLLVFGVSMRTLRPITGQTTNMRWMHIVVGSFALLGVPLLAAGLASNHFVLAWIGAALFVIAALGYAFDVFDILRRATNPHRPPQFFVAFGVLWFLAALAIGGGALAGKPWQPAYIVALLMGWIGQMVVAHFHHIGIRLVATVYRGEDDETRPQELLEPRLSWFTLLTFQIAIALVVVGLLDDKFGLIARGGVFGVAGWIAMTANVLAARARAKVPPKTVSLL